LTVGPDSAFYGVQQWYYNEADVEVPNRIFKIDENGNRTIIANLTIFDGRLFPLCAASDGNMYAVSNPYYLGDDYLPPPSIYRVTLEGTVTKVFEFPANQFPSYDRALIQGADGKLYGYSGFGGKAGWGCLFSVDLGLPALHVTNSIPLPPGNYFGLVTQTSGAREAVAGSFTVRLSASKQVAGQVTIRGRTLSFIGALDASDRFAARVHDGVLGDGVIDLYFSDDGTASVVEGSLRSDGFQGLLKGRWKQNPLTR
jgi:hypothetical protein